MFFPDIREVPDPQQWATSLNRYLHSFYITVPWLNAVKKEDESPIYLDFLVDNDIVAKVAGLSVRNRKKMPDLLYFYSGIAFKTPDETLIASCYQFLIRYAKKNKYDRVIIKSCDYDESFTYPSKVLIVDRKRSEYIVDLSVDENIILSKFNKTARRHIRKAVKWGLQVSESKSPEILMLLLEYLKETRNIRISKGYAPYKIFHLRNFDKKSLMPFLEQGLATMFLVFNKNKITSVIYILLHGKRAILFLIGTTQKGYELYAPTFLEYNIMILLKKRGFKSLNLGGIPYDSSHKGLIQYKKSLGAYKVSLLDQKTYYLLYPLRLLNPFLVFHDWLPDSRFLSLFKKAIRHFIRIFVSDDF